MAQQYLEHGKLILSLDLWNIQYVYKLFFFRLFVFSLTQSELIALDCFKFLIQVHKVYNMYNFFFSDSGTHVYFPDTLQRNVYNQFLQGDFKLENKTTTGI